MSTASGRRKFLRHSAAMFGALGIPMASWSRYLNGISPDASSGLSPAQMPATGPMMISTWDHGLLANAAGFLACERGGSALDMVEAAAQLVESDAQGRSVGLGGLPDRDGHVTLDACVMDHNGEAGSVCFVQNVLHPLSLARKVMEETPHVILAGAGAEKFAREIGMPETPLLTEEARAAWEEWCESAQYRPIINIENHDTIGILALDSKGQIAGGCTTSGLAYKMHGRVGDSPIIGAGLFVDGEVGAATATGLGEAVLRTVGSFLVVELMRQGKSPQQACEEAVHRIMRRQQTADLQVGYCALSTNGTMGAHAIHDGFTTAQSRNGQHELFHASFG